MPRVRLALRPSVPFEYHYDDPRRGITNWPVAVRRLYLRFDVVNNPRETDGVLCEGVVATDEPFCVFPNSAWTAFRDRFYPLTPPPTYPNPERWLYRGVHEFDFGMVWIVAYDQAVPDLVTTEQLPRVRRIRPVPVLGMFLRRPTSDVPEVRIGLRNSPLSGRRLVCESAPDDPENDHERWWLEES